MGAPLSGNVLIIDDVITAGTAIRHSVDLIRSEGATPYGVVIGLDRCERGAGDTSAVEEVRRTGPAGSKRYYHARHYRVVIGTA